MILILTCKEDVHADEVIRRLYRRKVEVFRLNTEDVLTHYKVVLHLDGNGSWSGELRDTIGRTLDLSKLRVAWYRKPNFDFNCAAPDAESKRLIATETRSFLDALYTLPGIAWINPPYRANEAKVKFQQLVLAAQYGVRVPRTIITTRPDRATEFFTECGEEVLTKPIYAADITLDGRSRAIPSMKVGREQFYTIADSIAAAPVQLQEYVPKDYEVRVTVIGQKAFAVRIDSQLHEETKVDWRLFAKLNKYSIIDLPNNIAAFCVALLLHQGLRYGAMDFIVTPTGDFVFLENNPYGQYLWLETETGVPLTEAMCDLLVSHLESVQH